MKYLLWIGLAVGVFAGIVLVAMVAITYPEDICTTKPNRLLMRGGATCSKTKTVLIIRGTEEYSVLYDSKCARFFATPAYDRVGGVAGRNYVGCALFQ